MARLIYVCTHYTAGPVPWKDRWIAPVSMLGSVSLEPCLAMAMVTESEKCVKTYSVCLYMFI